MQALKRLSRQIALGLVPVIGLLLFAPNPKGNAQVDVFDALLATIGGMSGSLLTMQQVQQSSTMFQQSILWPSSIMNQFQSEFTGLTSSNQGSFSGIFNVPIQSATLPASMSLESQMLSGNPSLVATAYANTYGSNLTFAQAPVNVVQSIGMTDATAMDSLQLGMSTDSTISMLIAQAQQIQSTASTSAPGVQDILTAQSMASQLECLAQQHRLYASLLREEAARLALQGMQYKQTATAVQNSNQGVQNVVGGQTP